MPLNVAMLNRVKERILAEPKHFDMSIWGGSVCSTWHCIGGWTEAIAMADGDMRQAEYVLGAGGDSDLHSALRCLFYLYEGTYTGEDGEFNPWDDVYDTSPQSAVRAIDNLISWDAARVKTGE